MKEKTGKTVRLCYGALLGAMSIVVGALFIWQVLTIYLDGLSPDYTGDYIFSRERVAESLKLISPAFWIWVAMIVVGFILWEVFPVAKKRAPYKDDCYALARLKKRIKNQSYGELNSSLEVIKKEERIILYTKLFAGIIILAIAIFSIIYLATPANFPKVNTQKEMLVLIERVLPEILEGFLLAIVVVVYEIYSARKQLPHAKKLVAYKGKTDGEQIKYRPENKFLDKVALIKAKIADFTDGKRFKLVVRVVIGCLAVAFFIAGICNGNMHGVLVKAINICTECIGLG
jgi:hypothetical protein